MRSCCLFGISTCFQVVSQAIGQVAHVLLTHPPLALLTSYRSIPLRLLARLACIRHAASVRPEPGSNSHFLMFVWMFAHSFQDSHLGFICLRNWLRSFVLGSLNPHIFAKTLFSFQGTTRCLLQRLKYLIRSCSLCQELFSDLYRPLALAAFVILLNLLTFVNWFCLIFCRSIARAVVPCVLTTVINTSNYFSFWQVLFCLFFLAP